jgi:hypothetical protein
MRKSQTDRAVDAQRVDAAEKARARTLSQKSRAEK